MRIGTILVVSDIFRSGGLETHLITLFKFLKKKGYRIYLLSRFSEVYDRRVDFYVDKKFQIDKKVEYSYDFFVYLYEKISSIIDYYKVDFLHLHPFVSFYSGFLAAVEKDIIPVLTFHGKISWFSLDMIDELFFERVIIPNAVILSVNKILYEELKANGAKNIYYFPNPIDSDVFKKVSEKKNREILIVSRLDKDKIEGIRNVLNELASLKRECEFDVLVAGDGDALEALKHDFKGFKFLGRLDSIELNKLMNKASIIGGMGRVILEGLFTKTPVFLIGYDGIKGFINSESIFDAASVSNFNGSNLQEVDIYEFRKELKDILSGKKEDALPNAVYKKAIDFYDIEKVGEYYINILDKAFSNDELKQDLKLIKKKDILFFKDYIYRRKELSYRENDIKELKERLIKKEEACKKLLEDIKDNIEKEKNRIISNFRHDLDRLKKEKESIKGELESCQRELRNIYSSKFWKLAVFKENVKRILWQKKHTFKKATDKVSNVVHSVERSKHIKDLEAILEDNRDKPVFIFPPLVDWNIPLFQRPQHLAMNLAKKGILYFFCTPNNRYDKVSGFEKILEGCYLTDRFDLVDKIESKKKIYDLYSTDNNTDWDFIKERLEKGNIIVYQYIDEISDKISGHKIPEKVFEKHRNVLKDERCIVVVSASKLEEEVKKYRKKNYVLVTNGVDVAHFSKAKNIVNYPEKVRIIKEKNKPIIGYFGALASWFDYELIIKLAVERKEYEILLIGVDYDGSLKRYKLDSYGNINVIGPIDYKELPYYASVFDVSIIPFVINEITLSTSPIKLFEYMAMGKPIVTTDMPECRKYKSVLIGKTHDEFIDKIDKALKLREDENYLKLLEEEAKLNSWENKAKDILNIVYDNLSR